MKFLMTLIFIFSCLLLPVNSFGQTKALNPKPKASYQKLANGKVVKVIEDSVIVNNSATTKIVPINKKPLIDFDTSFIPQDIFTQHIDELLQTTNVLSLAKRVTNRMIEALERKDSENEQFQLFYKRFSLKINNPLFDSLFKNLYIRNYRKFFTDEDVKQLLIFYTTPVAKKYLQLQPAISAGAMAEGEKLGKYFGSLVVYEIEAEKQNNK